MLNFKFLSPKLAPTAVFEERLAVRETQGVQWLLLLLLLLLQVTWQCYDGT